MYLLIALISFALTYIIKSIAQKTSWVDNRKEKNSHKTPTPTCGGLAFATAWFIGVFYLYLNKKIEYELFLALLPGIPLVFLGFLDDLFNLKQRFRLLIQMAAVAYALWALGGLQQLELGIASYQNPYFLNILAFIGITWVINLYNFQDGIDGYAGTQAVFLGIAGFLVFKRPELLVLAFAVSGFLFWNWHKAKIFMGDTGSLFLGYTLAVLAIHYQNQGTSILNFVILFTAFWCDSTATLIRDLWNREDIMKRHKRFIFHKLVTAGWSHQKVVLSAIGFNLLMLGIVIFANSGPLLFRGFIAALLLFFAVMIIVDTLEKNVLLARNKLKCNHIHTNRVPHIPVQTSPKKYVPLTSIDKNISFLKNKSQEKHIRPNPE